MMKLLLKLWLAFSLSSIALHAAPLRVGDRLPAFSAKDQHEKAFSYVEGEVSLLIVSFTMGSGKDANNWFAKQGADFLPKHKAVFLADIHGMPSVGRVFALPKMRKYPHRIILGDDEKLIQNYPRQKDKLTVFVFDAKGGISEIRHLDAETELSSLFGAK